MKEEKKALLEEKPKKSIDVVCSIGK